MFLIHVALLFVYKSQEAKRKNSLQELHTAVTDVEARICF